MEAKELQSKSKEEIFQFIREILTPEKGRLRFEMSGYDNNVGDCTVLNLGILNKFAFLGIYNYTKYIFLDFYKGTPIIYYQYFHDPIDKQEDLTGCSTADIIYRILELTIFSGCSRRRRR